MTAIIVRHEARDRFRISVRGHDVVVDQPAPASSDEGPTPVELFVASLAACAAFYARRFLDRHGLGEGELEVSCEFEWATDHSRVIAIALRILVPLRLPDGIEAALLRVIDRCTVRQSIGEGLAVTCDIVTADQRTPVVA